MQKLLAHPSVLKCIDHSSIKLFNNLVWKLRRPEHAEPGLRLEARNDFANRRKIRKRRLPRRTRDPVGAQISGPHLSGAGDEADEHQIHLPTQYIRERRRRSLVGYIHNIHISHHLESIPGKME